MRKCRYCKAEIPAVKDCADQFQRTGFCGKDHYIEHQTAKGLAAVKRKKEAEAKERKQDIRRRKEAAKTKPQLIKEAQKAFNEFIRLRDHDQPCICCGKFDNGSESWKLGGAYDAGHFLSVGSHPELRFTEGNCYRQLKSCNAGDGKYARTRRTISKRYEKRLRKLKGDELVDWLMGPHPMPNWTHDDLREIRNKYRKKARELKRKLSTD